MSHIRLKQWSITHLAETAECNTADWSHTHVTQQAETASELKRQNMWVT